MSRLPTIDPAHATGKVKDLLSAVQAKLGLTPNMTRVMANSPAVLEGYLNLSGALGNTLNAKLREQIALVVAEANRCEYCLSAHSAIGKMVGLNQDEITSSRNAQSSDGKTLSALLFARAVNSNRGQVTQADVQTVRAAGFSDAEIAEIVAHVALNVLTNYFNNATHPTVDFPLVSPNLQAA
jgi:uncharacterized peroxidase-related enzyme